MELGDWEVRVRSLLAGSSYGKQQDQLHCNKVSKLGGEGCITIQGLSDLKIQTKTDLTEEHRKGGRGRLEAR